MKTENAANAENLLDFLINRGILKNDAALAKLLEVAPPVISKIRTGKLPIGAVFLLRAHDVTGMSIKELRKLAGIPPIVVR